MVTERGLKILQILAERPVRYRSVTAVQRKIGFATFHGTSRELQSLEEGGFVRDNRYGAEYRIEPPGVELLKG